MAQIAETIAAQATPAGFGGIGVVRISGPKVRQIALELIGTVPAPRHATATSFLDPLDGRVLDYGIALFFPAPASYTGEDVLELHGHGGPVIVDQILGRVGALGARLARPGEFTERAFLNGKLDLVQAEAVADLIDSQTAIAARYAIRSLQGVFSKEINAISSVIAEIRVYVEANIDFSDEPVSDLGSDQAGEWLEQVREKILALVDRSRPGVLLARGAKVVLFGAPNVGKSSLLNALARSERAIVTATPGTTRDLIEVTVELDGLAVSLFDTAGLRDSNDEVEVEGVRRAMAAIESADLVLEVIDDLQPRPAEVGPGLTPGTAGIKRIVVFNKCDLSGRPFGAVRAEEGGHRVAISATTREGIECLEQAIQDELGDPTGEDIIMARRRHGDALQRAIGHLGQAKAHIISAPELLAEELRLAQRALGEITGEVTVEDLLGQIFSSFCIGK